MSKCKLNGNKLLQKINKHPWAFIFALAIIAYSVDGWARAGGGQSYSGGGGDYGGSSGGGDSVIVELLVRLLIDLIIECPEVGVPLLIIVVLSYIFRKQLLAWYNKHQGLTAEQQNYHRKQIGRKSDRRVIVVNKMLEYDKNFSEPVFYDFIQLLVVRLIRTLKKPQEQIAVLPYVVPAVLRTMEEELIDNNGEAIDVVIGGLSINNCRVSDGLVHLSVNVKAEFTILSSATPERNFVDVDLVLTRESGVLSKSPAAMTAFGCPSCGATANISASGVCGYCGTAVQNGRYSWIITAFELNQRLPRAIKPGNEHVAQMANIPTIYDPDLAIKKGEMQAAHPDFSEKQLQARVIQIYKAIQEAYSKQRWELARPYETDTIFDVHRFWIEYYKKNGRRNVLEKININKVELVKVGRDAFYEMVTLRIHADMLDYTVDINHRIISGSNRVPSRSAEYWTFIRSRSFKAATNADWPQCPSCGAQLKVNQSGKCEYCGTVVCNGDFDWVLSRIDQDVEYSG